MGLQFIHLSELDFGAFERDPQPFGVAEPAVLFGFSDAFFEIVDDVLEPVDLTGIRTEKGTTEACVLVVIACSACPSAAAQAELLPGCFSGPKI